MGYQSTHPDRSTTVSQFVEPLPPRANGSLAREKDPHVMKCAVITLLALIGSLYKGLTSEAMAGQSNLITCSIITDMEDAMDEWRWNISDFTACYRHGANLCEPRGPSSSGASTPGSLYPGPMTSGRLRQCLPVVHQKLPGMCNKVNFVRFVHNLLDASTDP